MSSLEPAFGAYLQAEGRPSQDATLGALMEHAQPIVQRVVAARLAGLWDDIDDVCSEARLELLLHLRRIKSDQGAKAIADLSAYVATVAANACNQYFRRRRPGRARLRRQIRFLLTQEAELTLRPSADGRLWCDLAGRNAPGNPALGNLDRIERRIEGDRDLCRLLVQILEVAGDALELDVVVDLVERVWRVPPDATPPPSGLPLDSIPAPGVETELDIDRRRLVARLWDEIRLLPRAQRVALLLHLRDHRGNSVLFLFPLCDVASFSSIAAVLEIPEEAMSRLWNRLPSDDNSIAGLLSATRQQVINLRMSARKRLTNRMRAFR